MLQSPRAHAVTSIAGQALTYDANGNMLSGRGRTFVWDGENRPTQILFGSSTSFYIYAPDGARLWKHTNSGPSGAQRSTLYLGADLETRQDIATAAWSWVKNPHPDAKIEGRPNRACAGLAHETMTEPLASQGSGASRKGPLAMARGRFGFGLIRRINPQPKG